MPEGKVPPVPRGRGGHGELRYWIHDPEHSGQLGAVGQRLRVWKSPIYQENPATTAPVTYGVGIRKQALWVIYGHPGWLRSWEASKEVVTASAVKAS